MSRVAVKETVLQWAMARSRTSAEALRSRFPKINEWLSGEIQPTLRQLEKFSTATTTPLGMLFLDNPPDEQLPIPHYRTVADKAVDRPSADLLDTIYAMQRRQDWMRDYLIDIGQPPLDFVNSVTLNQSVNAVAEGVRSVLGFGEMWASKFPTWEGAHAALKDAMERAGVLVFGNGVVGNNTYRALDPDEFRGFVLVDKHAPLVFVNSADPKTAQTFTLAHELAHVFYGSSAAFDLCEMIAADNRIERMCNAVAAEFLVPEKQLRDIWAAARESGHAFNYLARQFKVSAIVTARRALDLSLIDRATFFKFYRSHMAEQNARISNGGDFYASQNMRVGARFGAAVVGSLREGRIQYTEAYSLTGLHGNTFENFAAGIDT